MQDFNLQGEVTRLQQELLSAKSAATHLQGQLEAAQILLRDTSAASDRYLLRSVISVEKLAKVVTKHTVALPTGVYCPWCLDRAKRHLLEDVAKLVPTPKEADNG